MEHLAELVTAVLASRRASPADDSFMSNADALGAEHERDVIAKSDVYYYYYYYYYYYCVASATCVIYMIL